MRIGVAYADPAQAVWLKLDLPDNTTLRDAVARSGILDTFPHLDLATLKVGIFGKIVPPDTPLRDGDRVEIYRPIQCDPSQVPRRGGAEDGDDSDDGDA